MEKQTESSRIDNYLESISATQTMSQVKDKSWCFYPFNSDSLMLHELRRINCEQRSNCQCRISNHGFHQKHSCRNFAESCGKIFALVKLTVKVDQQNKVQQDDPEYRMESCCIS